VPTSAPYQSATVGTPSALVLFGPNRSKIATNINGLYVSKTCTSRIMWTFQPLAQRYTRKDYTEAGEVSGGTHTHTHTSSQGMRYERKGKE